MTRSYLLTILIVISITTSVLSASGVECRLSLYQYDAGSQRDVLLHDDTSQFALNVPATGFLGPFSVEIEFQQIDTNLVAFNAHVVTLGPPVNTYSRSFRMEYGLPARISGIEGKNAARYTLIVVPLEQGDIDPACTFSPRNVESFTSSPSAYMDLYYVPNSLGDYYWESVRDVLDMNYRRFMGFANLTLPGKMMVYLCPCFIPSVIWDKRFGMAVDPTRNTAFAIYGKLANGADPFLVTYTSLLRNYGYAPPLVAEGLANYFSFVLVDMRRIVKEQPDFSLEDLLNTHRYLSTDPFVADRASACFVQYLIKQYEVGRFMELYTAADDLNLKATVESVYERTFTELEADWRQWIDTAAIQPSDYSEAVEMAEHTFNYDLMQQQAELCLQASASVRDSVKALGYLRRAYFFNGDYYGATRVQTLLLEIDSTDATAWMARGSYRMMNGLYDEALGDLKKAQSLDTANQMIRLNLALNYLYRGDETTAGSMLLDNLSNSKTAMAQGETRLFLAQILEKSRDSLEIAHAAAYYQQAAAMYQQMLQIQRSSASNYMWLAVATLGLGETDTALELLQLAEFLETRPFYYGMINLWLGKAHLSLGDKAKARDHLARVLSGASADYHQREARQYLEKL